MSLKTRIDEKFRLSLHLNLILEYTHQAGINREFNSLLESAGKRPPIFDIFYFLEVV
jgi:hypothetical protein